MSICGKVRGCGATERHLAMAVNEDHEMISFTLEVRKKVLKLWKWGIILFLVGVAGYLKLPL